jgi:hypothetical protein
VRRFGSNSLRSGFSIDTKKIEDFSSHDYWISKRNSWLSNWDGFYIRLENTYAQSRIGISFYEYSKQSIFLETDTVEERNSRSIYFSS